MSVEAAAKIKAATNYFHNSLSLGKKLPPIISKHLHRLLALTITFLASHSTAGNLTDLIHEMGLCEPYPQSIEDWNTLYTSLIFTYQSGTEYNYGSALAGPFNISRPLQVIINQTLVANSTGAVLRVPLQLYSLEPPEHCLVWNSSRFSTNSVLSTTPWQRVQCLSMPASANDVPAGNVFPEHPDAVNQTAQCLSLGLSPSFALKTNKEIIEYYCITREDLINTKRLLFTQGGYDPTTSVGPPPFPLSEHPDATRTVLMYGNAHTEEIYSELLDDSELVKLVSIGYQESRIVEKILDTN
jgi:hypothetical protein